MVPMVFVQKQRYVKFENVRMAPRIRQRLVVHIRRNVFIIFILSVESVPRLTYSYVDMAICK